MKPLLLRGISWNHSRAFPPLVAAAQRFEEMNPNTRVVWEKRSLHEFGHADLATLAQSFDLLVLDHPMLGAADRAGVLLDLNSMLPSEALQQLQQDALGPCLESYWFHGKLYALPIDAAAPGASMRVDLLERAGVAEPERWSDVLALARRGMVQMPGFPADLFLNFMALCVSHGSTVAPGEDQFLDRAVALRSLEEMRELASLMPGSIYDMNPIALYEAMSSQDGIAYCPFAYTYNNYSRRGFSRARLRFNSPVLLDNGRRVRTVLGGTGLAISHQCRERDLALAFGLFVAGRECQSTLYAWAGGQPANASAWHDEILNQITDNFFQRTLSSVKEGYVRPRYDGYIALQEQGALPIIEYFRNGGDPNQVLDRVEELYRSSLSGRKG